MAFNDDEEPPPAKPAEPARPMRQVQLTKYHNRKAPLAPSDQTVVLELKGASSAASRAPLDLVAVMDVSISMSGSRLDSTKKALRFIIRKLTDHDRLSIVQFDHEATRLCALRCTTEAAQAELETLVGSIKTRGATNIQAGSRLPSTSSRNASSPPAVPPTSCSCLMVGRMKATQGRSSLATCRSTPSASAQGTTPR